MISSVYATVDSVYVLSDVPASSPRSWVAGAGAGRFGWAVSKLDPRGGPSTGSGDVGLGWLRER